MDGKRITKPKEIAKVQINYFTEKIEKLKNYLHDTNIDPLALLRNSIQRWGSQAERRPEFKIT